MKLWQKILVIILAVLVLAGTLLPALIVNAAPETENTTSNIETVETTGEAEEEKEDETENNNEEDIIYEGTTTKIKLKDMDMTEDTDNVILYFINKENNINAKVSLQKKTNYETVVILTPGEYKVKFSSADNKRELKLSGNTVTIPDVKQAEVEIGVKKILNNNFLPKFFRNNSFLLILIAITGICYYVLKKKREMGIINTQKQD